MYNGSGFINKKSKTWVNIRTKIPSYQWPDLRDFYYKKPPATGQTHKDILQKGMPINQTNCINTSQKVLFSK